MLNIKLLNILQNIQFPEKSKVDFLMRSIIKQMFLNPTEEQIWAAYCLRRSIFEIDSASIAELWQRKAACAAITAAIACAQNDAELAVQQADMALFYANYLFA